MYKVHADLHKNRLYLTLSGTLSLPEMDAAAAAVDREIHKLRPGFAVIQDLTTFHPADPAHAAAVAALHARVEARGVRVLVRVITAGFPPDLAKKPAGYRALAAEDAAEADRLLDAAG